MSTTIKQEQTILRKAQSLLGSTEEFLLTEVLTNLDLAHDKLVSNKDEYSPLQKIDIIKILSIVREITELNGDRAVIKLNVYDLGHRAYGKLLDFVTEHDKQISLRS